VWGESVAAFIVRRPDMAASASEIIDWFLQRLASYKKPKQIRFVESLPKNVTGKVSKQALRETLVGQQG
jgi:acyl-CoA synthetase (AMP-forming)/AMP-acid ligase II